jgi:hypothetical protein
MKKKALTKRNIIDMHKELDINITPDVILFPDKNNNVIKVNVKDKTFEKLNK